MSARIYRVLSCPLKPFPLRLTYPMARIVRLLGSRPNRFRTMARPGGRPNRPREPSGRSASGGPERRADLKRSGREETAQRSGKSVRKRWFRAGGGCPGHALNKSEWVTGEPIRATIPRPTVSPKGVQRGQKGTRAVRIRSAVPRRIAEPAFPAARGRRVVRRQSTTAAKGSNMRWFARPPCRDHRCS